MIVRLAKLLTQRAPGLSRASQGLIALHTALRSASVHPAATWPYSRHRKHCCLRALSGSTKKVIHSKVIFFFRTTFLFAAMGRRTHRVLNPDEEERIDPALISSASQPSVLTRDATIDGTSRCGTMSRIFTFASFQVNLTPYSGGNASITFAAPSGP